ncbi:peptidase, M28 family, partial [Opisthorchis viverrini]
MADPTETSDVLINGNEQTEDTKEYHTYALLQVTVNEILLSGSPPTDHLIKSNHSSRAMDARRRSSTSPGGGGANATTDPDNQSSASIDLKSHSSYDEGDTPIPLSFWLKSISLFFLLTLMSSSVYRPCLSSTDRNVTPAPHQFIGANARRHLQKVTFLGSRTSGSLANEVLAPEYLLSELYDIARLGKSNGVDIFVDEQLSSAASFRTGYAVQSYKNVKNLLIRFHNSSLSNHTTAFLVNCHYDSFLGSPGATDTFVNCAILLEAGRAIATGKVQLVNDLIFLFNGAEESGLLTSHAFVTQHRWSNDVKSFLNLEGTGAGGRLFVFQSSSDESSQLLLGTYESCFHYPYADVFGEEIFQSGLIPSDTDFRIFRDFGFVPGLDMAYVRDGYAYHTPFDTEARISEECLQQNGEEILRFLSAVGGDKRLESVSKLKSVNDTGLPSSGPPLNELSSTKISRSQLPKPKVQTSAHHRHVYFDILGIKLFVRLSVFHIDRTFHGSLGSKELEGQESFITILAWDGNGIQYLKPQTGLKFLDDNENGKPNGLRELLEATPAYCNFSLPYCGIPFFRPLFHFFTDFYHIPAKQHGSKPVAQLDVISRIPLASSQLQSGRVAWNFTFSLRPGPPQTPLALRFDVPHVRLLNWSFAVDTSVPVPVPLTKSPSDPHVESVGAHYFLDFIDARASISLPVEPWVFWLVIDRPSDMESSHFDIAVMG